MLAIYIMILLYGILKKMTHNVGNIFQLYISCQNCKGLPKILTVISTIFLVKYTFTKQCIFVKNSCQMLDISSLFTQTNGQVIYTPPGNITLGNLNRW